MRIFREGNDIVAAMAVTDDGDSLGIHVLAVNPDMTVSELTRIKGTNPYPRLPEVHSYQR